MRRREFIMVLGGAAAGWPLAARAQQAERVRRIGVLMGVLESLPVYRANLGALREGLQTLGWSDGRNIRIDTRWAAPGNMEALQLSAKELVAMQPDLILSHMELGVAGKWLELLKEIAPRVSRVAFLFNPTTAPYAEYFLKPFKAAAESLAVEAIAAPVRDTSELASVIGIHAREPNGGLIVMPDAFTETHITEITSLAETSRLPSVYPFRYWAELGGLLSYGVEQTDNFRRAATYADRILKGTKPSDLPVQGPVKINLKTAKALGLDVPWFLQQRADEVIE